MNKRALSLALFVSASVLATAQTTSHPFETEADRRSTIQTKGTCFIRVGRIITVTGETIRNGQILVRNGKIAAIGTNLTAPSGVKVIDALDQVVMPGIVDAHVHRGIDSTNEGSEALTAEVRIADVLNPDSLTWWQALASGETTALALHGSANPIGGESVVIKFKYRHPTAETIFPGAPRMIKFALGENVTRMNSPVPTTGTRRFPATRMGVEAVYRRAFNEAQKYMGEWNAWNDSDKKSPPPRKDLRLETLSDILRRKVWVHCHSYRADEILMMAKLSKEFGFKIGSMQHSLEAYKVAPELAALGVPASMFQDNWSFKLEGYDAIPSGPMICYKAGVITSINTDGTNGTTALIIDGAKLMREGLTENEAFRTLTLNPAIQLGVDKQVGSIEVGKDADLAFYDGHPFNVSSKQTMTMVDGHMLFTRRDAFGVGRSADAALDVRDIPSTDPVEMPPIAKRYVIDGATVHPVSGPSITNGVVVISDGKIAYVGNNAPGELVSGATRVNGRGMHLYPGLIDAGGAYGLSEISGIRQMNDLIELGDFQPDLRAATAVQNASAHFGPALTNGILSVVTRPGGGLISGQGALMRTWGWSTGTMTIDHRLAMQINVPAAPAPPREIPSDACACMGDSLQDILDGIVHEHDEDHGPMAQDTPGRQGRQGGAQDPSAFQGRLKQLDDYFAAARAYGEKRRTNFAGTPMDPQMEAMLPVVRREQPVFLRTRSVRSILTAIDFAKKNNLRAILVGANEAWRIADEVKKSGYPVLITPAGKVTLGANTVSQPYDPYDTPYVVPALLERAGIPYAFQSDDNAQGMNLPNRVGMHTAYGLTHDQAIRALTLSSAEILGFGRELGSIEVGKRATFFLTSGSPISATSNVKIAFIDGRPVPLVSKHTQLRDHFMKRLDPAERDLFQID